jgi:molybdate transport repressor ModE-like protein
MAGSKGDMYYNVFLDFTIWLKSIENKTIITEDCFLLLKEIDNHGSLKLAAEKTNVSYRKAWNMIKFAENLLGFHLVQKHRGGKDGGFSLLSPEGKNLLLSYLELKSNFESSIKIITKKFFNTINQKNSEQISLKENYEVS